MLPNYALRQWLIAADGSGIAAALYGPSRFSTTIDGQSVSIDEQTEYPFDETIQFVVHTTRPVMFGLTLRLPGWTSDPQVDVNGKAMALAARPGSFTTIRRTFADGDTVTLRLPMSIVIRTGSPPDTASIERGPLIYSLKIDETATAVEDATTRPGFPAWDKRPASAWNYALAIPDANIDQVHVVTKPIDGFPFDIGRSPIELTAPGHLVTNWTLRSDGGNPTFPRDPLFSPETTQLTLVPYGSTCLRLTVMPVAR
jgi:hypothetical protein